MRHRARWVVFGNIVWNEVPYLYRNTSYNTKLTKDEAIEKFHTWAKEFIGDSKDCVVTDVTATFYEENEEDE